MRCNNCTYPIVHEKLEKDKSWWMEVSDEAEYCHYCNEAYCNDCIDWEYMNKNSLEKTVCNLCSPIGYEYSFKIGE